MSKDDKVKVTGKRKRMWLSENLKITSGNNEERWAWMAQWARDMHAWGEDVRDDIIRLEGHAGFASGDPGDPPDGPPEEDPPAPVGGTTKSAPTSESEGDSSTQA